MSQLPFQPAPGLFTDTSTFSGKGGWIDSSNVRFWNGRWQVIGGWAQRGSLTLASVNAIHEWRDSDGNNYIAWGADGALKVEKNGSLFDVSPGLFTGKWSFANWGETLIACNLNGTSIFQWSLNTASAAVAVTNAPAQATTVLVTPQRQLLAFGCNEELSGTFNGRCVRGSDLEDLTDWTTSATNNAFEHILDGATSAIVCAKLVDTYVAVWTSTELFMGQFIGDPSQTYRFDRVAGNCGSISLNGVVVVNGTAYWLTPDLRFMAWSPGAPPTEIACPIINDFRSLFPTASAKVAATFASYVAKFNEVWFTYSNTATLYVGRYVAFSLTDGKWFKGSAGRCAMHQGLSSVLGATVQGNALITCESGQKGFALATPSQTSLNWSITSSQIFVDSGRRRFMLRTLYPDFEDQAGNVTVTVTMSDRDAQGVGASKALVVASNTGKKDFRLSGQILAVQFSGSDGTSVGVSGSTTAARQGLCIFDLVPTGER